MESEGEFPTLTSRSLITSQVTQHCDPFLSGLWHTFQKVNLGNP